MWSGIVASTVQVADWATSTFVIWDDVDMRVRLSVLAIYRILATFASIVFYGFVLRFYSVQTQLKTENENTLAIMRKIAQAKFME